MTTAVHAGERAPRPDFTPVSTPIYSTVGYLYEEMDDLDGIFGGVRAGYVYGRYGNPTVSALEQAVAALEGADGAVAYATGMAAVHAALLGAGVCQGAHIVAAADLYGATYSLLDRLFAPFGVASTFVRIDDLDAVADAVQRTRPAVVYCETISNPLMRVADLPALAGIAHGGGAMLVVDSTFTSPYLLRPLALGADLVVHSATKYLAGHGDVMGGVVLGSAERVARLRDQLKLIGGNLGPFEAWLVLRGIKTLPLRVRQQCENAARLAHWLAVHDRIAQVNYPGLATHPQHALATEMLAERGYGGMLSFVLRDADQSVVFRFMEALQLVLPATTLGDVYSLVLYPPHSSHRQMPPEVRERVGIGEGLVRMSVGIEAASDIIADLDQALGRI
jgi:cystathionine gamma-synthase/methionine-gamma-lyase